MKNQLNLLAIWAYNSVLNIIPFRSLKRMVFRLFGKKIGKQSYIHGNIKLFSLSKITIGENTTINPRVYLDGRKSIKIGNNVMISHDAKIYTLGHDVDDPDFKSKGAPVVIRDNVVIFSGAVIQPGVEIGEGAVIYPYSVVCKNVEPFSIVGGNPARVLRVRKKEIRYRLNYKYWAAI